MGSWDCMEVLGLRFATARFQAAIVFSQTSSRRSAVMKWLVIGLTVLLAALTLWLGVAGEVLITPAAPLGIVSYELAFDAGISQAILDSWSGHPRDMALLIQGVDYLYLMVYPLWFALCSMLLGRKLGGGWYQTGRGVAGLSLLAAPLDAIENYALIQQLLYGANGSLAKLAYWTAVPKFLVVMVGAAFISGAIARYLLNTFLSQENTTQQ